MGTGPNFCKGDESSADRMVPRCSSCYRVVFMTFNKIVALQQIQSSVDSTRTYLSFLILLSRWSCYRGNYIFSDRSWPIRGLGISLRPPHSTLQDTAFDGHYSRVPCCAKRKCRNHVPFGIVGCASATNLVLRDCRRSFH